MAPPKKDIFADLFQTANSGSNTNTNKLSLHERQTAAKSEEKHNLGNHMNNSNSSWSNLDFLSGSEVTNANSGAGSALSLTPQTQSTPTGTNTSSNDPFDIFNSTTPKKQEKLAKPENINNIMGQSAGSLLDDDFTDAFYVTPAQASVSINKIQTPEEQKMRPSLENSTRSSINNSSTSVNSMSKKDHVLAELVDIGFSVNDANEAISVVGTDLQECVNYVMNKGNPKNSQRSSKRGPQKTKSPLSNINEGDITAKLNDLSNDLFNKASFFLNKSKDTVIKNIKQYQDGMSEVSDPNMPAWMKSQHRYKADAIEKKYKDLGAVDYGLDEDNINKDAINEFMRMQKEKDKEKAKLRYNNWKQMAKESISSGKVSPAPIRDSSQPISPSIPSNAPSRSYSNSPTVTSTSTSTTSSSRSKLQTSPLPRTTPSPPKQEPNKSVTQEFDLLGLNESTSRSDTSKKSEKTTDTMYVPSSRRRARPSGKTVATPLNEFQQSNYFTSKQRAAELFTNGDYDNALKYYLRALDELPPKHELRVIMNSNVSINYIKLGDYKRAREHCDSGLELIENSDLNNANIQIDNKPVKAWYIKLLSRRAESLEMLELFKESLNDYVELIQLGVNDKKIMDGKRRVNNICNPPAKKMPKQKSPATRSPSSSSSRSSTPNNENLSKLRERDEKIKIEEKRKFELHDVVQEKLHQWSNGKEDNIRSLLLSLPTILPERLGFTFLTTKKLTMNDLMLPKKVKINYMKVISNIHPDKSGNFDIEDKMLCQGAFITLNKSWDIFKEQNGMN